MSFMKNGTCTTFDIQMANLIARPALAGAWIEVYFRGRTTQYGTQAVPIMGSLQFNAYGKRSLWSRFDLYQPNEPQAFRGQYDDQLIYSGYVSYAQLEDFEKERNGKNFSVNIQASLKVLNQEGLLEQWSLGSHETLNKNSQEWLGILSGCGYKNYLFHDLTFPVGSSARPDSVFALLRQARDLFDKALYRQCITVLRSAEEKLRDRRQDKEGIIEAMKKSGSAKDFREAMSLDERLLSLRGHVQSALHAGAHHPEPDSAFTRERAKSLLIIVSALIELFPEPPEMDIKL